MSPRKHVFPFFRLPTELRDIIYESCHDFKVSRPRQFTFKRGSRNASTRPSSVHVSADLKDGLLVNLLLISKQFAAEYRSRKQHPTTLIIGQSSRPSSKDAAHFPRVARMADEVEFNIVGHTGCLSRELFEKWDWMSGVLSQSLPHVQKSQVTVKVHMLKHLDRLPVDMPELWRWERLGCEAFQGLTAGGVGTIRVYSFFNEYQGGEHGFPFDVEWEEIGNWSEAEGWKTVRRGDGTGEYSGYRRL